MIATTAAKIGRSMKNRENMRAGRGGYCATTMSTRRALSSAAAPPVTLAGAARRIALRLDAGGDELVADRKRPPLGQLDVGGGVAGRIRVAGHRQPVPMPIVDAAAMRTAVSPFASSVAWPFAK